MQPAGRNPRRKRRRRVAQKEELTTDNHDVIATLNDLLEISRDGEQGFQTCVEGVESPDLKALFEVAARRCAEGAAELEAQVRSLGGEPAKGESIKRLDASRLDQHKARVGPQAAGSLIIIFSFGLSSLIPGTETTNQR